MKQKKHGFLSTLLTSLAAWLVLPVISSVAKVISGRRVSRAARKHIEKNS